MICIVHGYLLDGSGSNLWTRCVIESLVRQGETVHLVCQEYHPERFDFIAEAYRYCPDRPRETIFKRDVPYPGRAIFHKPQIGPRLPVYVRDRYEEFTDVVPMIDLPDDAINHYLDRNTAVLTQVVKENSITAIHVNHAVLMSVAAERAGRATSVPFAIMPHGSDIEYAIKKDERFLRLATGALTAAGRVFVIGQEMRRRVLDVFPTVAGIDAKMTELNLGADTALFEPIPHHLRSANIGKLCDLLAEAPRGKMPEMTERLLESLSAEAGFDALEALVRSSADYTNKLPDSDVESKLGAVDWDADNILLFVGRIIASKGLQSVVAALPGILDRHPSTRLIVVGHGPLREPLEALRWALERHATALVENLIEWAGALEGSGRKPLIELRGFFDRLRARGELADYFEKARRHIRSDRIIFTGYLTHRELRYLFPCADVALFPSVVAEAGPLVFLEALASGCFPLGTYFAGMAASIDSVATALPAADAELMRLSPDKDRTVEDIITNTSGALALAGKHKETLRSVAVERYDWTNVARRLSAQLRSLS